jgi:hypothetical protein
MDEDRLIYVLLIVIAAPTVITTFTHRGGVGPGQTLACLLALLGIFGLVRAGWAHRELIPRARSRKRR